MSQIDKLRLVGYQIWPPFTKVLPETIFMTTVSARSQSGGYAAHAHVVKSQAQLHKAKEPKPQDHLPAPCPSHRVSFPSYPPANHSISWKSHPRTGFFSFCEGDTQSIHFIFM